MCDPTGGILTAAVIGLAGTAYGVHENNKVATAQRQAQERVAQQQKSAQDEANRIAQEQLDADKAKTSATNILFKPGGEDSSSDTPANRFAFRLFDNGVPTAPQPPNTGMKPPTLGV